MWGRLKRPTSQNLRLADTRVGGVKLAFNTSTGRGNNRWMLSSNQ